MFKCSIAGAIINHNYLKLQMLGQLLLAHGERSLGGTGCVTVDWEYDSQVLAVDDGCAQSRTPSIYACRDIHGKPGF